MDNPNSDDLEVADYESDGDEHQNEHSGVTIRVRRPIFTQQDYNETYNVKVRRKSIITEIRRYWCRDFYRKPSRQCAKKTILSLLPFIRIMRDYKPSYLLCDILAGVMIGVMHIPQGMAFGLLADLSPVYGLYTSLFPVAVYFFFGTSKHISIGAFSVVSIMIGNAVSMSDCGKTFQNSANLADRNDTVHTVTESEEHCKVGVAVAVTFLVGVYQIVLGVFRFGFVTVYLSEPLTRGLTFGAAVHVATSQIRSMFDVDMGSYHGGLKLVKNYVAFFRNIENTNLASVVTCAVAMIVIFVVQQWINPRVKKKIKVPIPIELIVVIVATLVSSLAKFLAIYGLKVVGPIPRGIPGPRFPPASQFSYVAGGAAGIAIVSFSISIAMAKLFAKKHNYSLDADQEWLAYGIANVVGSVLNCYACTASMSRSLVQEGSGGKTQVAGLFSCCLLLTVLLAVGGLLEDLPICVLSAIILVNLKGILLHVLDIRSLYQHGQYIDLMTWVVVALAVVLTEVDIGLYVGVGFTLLTVVFRNQRPHATILGRIPRTDIYENVKHCPVALEVPGIKVFGFSSSLSYANADYFTRSLYDRTNCNPERVKNLRKQAERLTAKKSKREKKLKNKVSPNETSMISNQTRRTQLSDVDEASNAGALLQEDLQQQDDDENVEGSPKPHTTANPSRTTKCAIHTLIIDCSAMVFVDSTGVATLRQVVALRGFNPFSQTFRLLCNRFLRSSHRTEISYALLDPPIWRRRDDKAVYCERPLIGLKDDVYNSLQRAGLFNANTRTVFVGIHDAVLSALESNPQLLKQVRRDSTAVLGSILNNFPMDENDVDNLETAFSV